MILQHLPNITKAFPNRPAKPIIPKNMGTIAEMIRSKGHVSSSYSYSKSISNKLSDGVFVPLYHRASFAIEKRRHNKERRDTKVTRSGPGFVSAKLNILRETYALLGEQRQKIYKHRKRRSEFFTQLQRGSDLLTTAHGLFICCKH
uniref:Uncharacterized protein n=1 Tax=Glossina austeni TaxID=7395 RepID=A0A1A9UD44_GLOAU